MQRLTFIWRSIIRIYTGEDRHDPGHGLRQCGRECMMGMRSTLEDLLNKGNRNPRCRPNTAYGLRKQFLSDKTVQGFLILSTENFVRILYIPISQDTEIWGCSICRCCRKLGESSHHFISYRMISIYYAFWYLRLLQKTGRILLSFHFVSDAIHLAFCLVSKNCHGTLTVQLSAV